MKKKPMKFSMLALLLACVILLRGGQALPPTCDPIMYSSEPGLSAWTVPNDQCSSEFVFNPNATEPFTLDLQFMFLHTFNSGVNPILYFGDAEYISHNPYFDMGLQIAAPANGPSLNGSIIQMTYWHYPACEGDNNVFQTSCYTLPPSIMPCPFLCGDVGCKSWPVTCLGPMLDNFPLGYYTIEFSIDLLDEHSNPAVGSVVNVYANYEVMPLNNGGVAVCGYGESDIEVYDVFSNCTEIDATCGSPYSDLVTLSYRDANFSVVNAEHNATCPFTGYVGASQTGNNALPPFYGLSINYADLFGDHEGWLTDVSFAYASFSDAPPLLPYYISNCNVLNSAVEQAYLSPPYSQCSVTESYSIRPFYPGCNGLSYGNTPFYISNLSGYSCNFVIPWSVDTPTGLGIYNAFPASDYTPEFINLINYDYAFTSVSFVAFDKTANTQTFYTFNFTECAAGSKIDTQQCDCAIGCDTYYASTVVYSDLNRTSYYDYYEDPGNHFLTKFVVGTQPIQPYQYEVPGYTVYNVGGHLAQEAQCGILIHVTNCTKATQVWLYPTLVETRQLRVAHEIGYTSKWIQCVIKGVEGQIPTASLWTYPVTNNINNMTVNNHGVSFSIEPTVTINGSVEVYNFTQVYGFEMINVNTIPFGGVYISCSTTHEWNANNIQLFHSTPDDPKSNRYFCTSGVNNDTRPINLNSTTPGVAVARTDLFNITNGTDFGFIQVYVGPSCNHESLCSENGWTSESRYTYTDNINGINLVFPNASANYMGEIGQPAMYYNFYDFVASPGFVDVAQDPYHIFLMLSLTNIQNIGKVVVSIAYEGYPSSFVECIVVDPSYYFDYYENGPYIVGWGVIGTVRMFQTMTTYLDITSCLRSPMTGTLVGISLIEFYDNHTCCPPIEYRPMIAGVAFSQSTTTAYTDTIVNAFTSFVVDPSCKLDVVDQCSDFPLYTYYEMTTATGVNFNTVNYPTCPLTIEIDAYTAYYDGPLKPSSFVLVTDTAYLNMTYGDTVTEVAFFIHTTDPSGTLPDLSIQFIMFDECGQEKVVSATVRHNPAVDLCAEYPVITGYYVEFDRTYLPPYKGYGVSYYGIKITSNSGMVPVLIGALGFVVTNLIDRYTYGFPIRGHCVGDFIQAPCECRTCHGNPQPVQILSLIDASNTRACADATLSNPFAPLPRPYIPEQLNNTQPLIQGDLDIFNGFLPLYTVLNNSESVYPMPISNDTVKSNTEIIDIAQNLGCGVFVDFNTCSNIAQVWFFPNPNVSVPADALFTCDVATRGVPQGLSGTPEPVFVTPLAGPYTATLNYYPGADYGPSLTSFQLTHIGTFTPTFGPMGFEVAISDNAPLNGVYISCWLAIPEDIFANMSYCQARGLANGSYTVDVTGDVVPFSNGFYNTSESGCYQRQLVMEISSTCDETPLCGQNGFNFDYTYHKLELTFGILGYAWSIMAPDFGFHQSAEPSLAIGYFGVTAPEFVTFWHNASYWLDADPALDFAVTIFIQMPQDAFEAGELIVTMENSCFSNWHFSFTPNSTHLDGEMLQPTDFMPGYSYAHGREGPISVIVGAQAVFTDDFKELVYLGVQPEDVVFKFEISNLTRYAAAMKNLTTIQTLFQVYGVSLEIVDYRFSPPLVSHRVASTPSPTCRPGNFTNVCVPCNSNNISVSAYYRDTSATYVDLGTCPYNIQFQSDTTVPNVTSPTIGVGMSTANAGFVYSQTPGTYSVFKGFTAEFGTTVPEKDAYLTTGIAFSSLCGSDTYIDQNAFHSFYINLTSDPACTWTPAAYLYTVQGSYTAANINSALVNASWISLVFLPKAYGTTFFLASFNLLFADYVGGVFVGNRNVSMNSPACNGNYRQETCVCHSCANKDFPDSFGYDILADVEVTSQLTCNEYLQADMRRLATPRPLVNELPYAYPTTYYLTSSYSADPDNLGLATGAFLAEDNFCGVLIFSPACYRSIQVWLNPLQSLFANPITAQCIIQSNYISDTLPVVILGGAAYGNFTLKYTSFINQYQINVSFAATPVGGGYMFNQGPYGFELPFFKESPVDGYYISCLLVNNGENIYSGLNFCVANSTTNTARNVAVMRNLSTWYTTQVQSGPACNERVLTIRASPKCEQAELCDQYKASVNPEIGYAFDYKGFEYSAGPNPTLVPNFPLFNIDIDLNSTAVLDVIDSAFTGAQETMNVLVLLNFKFNTLSTSITNIQVQLISKCESLPTCIGTTVVGLGYYTGVAGSGYALGYPADSVLFAQMAINMSTCMSLVKTSGFDIRQFYLHVNMQFTNYSGQSGTTNWVYLDGVTVATLPFGTTGPAQSVVYSNSVVYRPSSQNRSNCEPVTNLVLNCTNQNTHTQSSSHSYSRSFSHSPSNSQTPILGECSTRPLEAFLTAVVGSIDDTCRDLTGVDTGVVGAPAFFLFNFLDFNVTYPPKYGHNNITAIVFTATQDFGDDVYPLKSSVGLYSGFCDSFDPIVSGINITVTNDTLSTPRFCTYLNYDIITKTKIHFHNFEHIPVDKHARFIFLATGLWDGAVYNSDPFFLFNLTVYTNFHRYSVMNITSLCTGPYTEAFCVASPTESKSESTTQRTESESQSASTFESESMSQSESASESASASTSSRSYETCCERSVPLSSVVTDRVTQYCDDSERVHQAYDPKTCPNTDYPILLYPGSVYQLKDYVVENPAYSWYHKNITQLGLQLGYINLQFSTNMSNVKLFYTPGQGTVRIYGVARMVATVGSCTLPLNGSLLETQPWIVDITVKAGLNSVPYLSRQPISYGGYPFFVVETDPAANNISIPVFRSQFNRGVIYPDGFPQYNITFGLQTLSPVVIDVSLNAAIAGSIGNAEMIITSSPQLAIQQAGSSWTGIAAFQMDTNCSGFTGFPAPPSNQTYQYLQWLGCQNYENTQPRDTPWPASNGTGWMLFGVESSCSGVQPMTPGIPGPSNSQSKSQSSSRQITQSHSAQLSPLPPPNITNYNITRQPRVCYPFNATGGEVPAFMVQFGSSGTVCGIINDATTVPVSVNAPGVYYGSSNVTLNPWDYGLFLDYYAIFNTSVVEGGDVFVKFNLFTVVARVAIYIKIQWYTGSSSVPLPGNFQTLVGVNPATASMCGMAGSSIASCIIPFPAYNHPLYIGYRTTPRYVLPFNVQLRGVVITPLTWSPVTVTSYCAIAPNITLGTFADGACRSGGGGSNPSDGTYSFNERVLVDGLDIILTSGTG